MDVLEATTRRHLDECQAELTRHARYLDQLEGAVRDGNAPFCKEIAEVILRDAGRLPAELDFDARYSVAGYGGIAFYLLGYVPIIDEDSEWSGFERADPDRVRAVMVGDDRVHEVDVCDLTRLDDDAYCSVCGQIGCSHDGR